MKRAARVPLFPGGPASETLRGLNGRRGCPSFRLPRLMNCYFRESSLLAVAWRDSVERLGFTH